MSGAPRRIPLEPLSAAAFAPFGTVLGAAAGRGRPTNLGTAERFDEAAPLVNARPGARPNLAVFVLRPQPLPLAITLLERHPHSSQVFAALGSGRWLVAVAPARADGAPDPAGLRAFVAGAGDAICFAPGTWHHPVIALDRPAELLMLAWEDGGPGDCETVPLAPAVEAG